MGMNQIKQELKDNYIDDNFSLTEFEKVLKSVMNSDYVKTAIMNEFQEQQARYIESKLGY